MEIQELRKEFNQLLDNINQHSARFTDKNHLPSLEISVMLSKVNKLQEVTAVMKHSSIQIEESRGRFKEELIESEELLDQPKEEKPEVSEEIVVETTDSIIVEDLPENLGKDLLEETLKDDTKPTTNIEQLPVAKLADAFSLNDRYLFANELFNKDMAAFNEVVKNIDASNNFEDAKTILIAIGSERDWDVEDENVLSFTNLVERRFL